jgi:hypothetical protein
MMGEIFPKGSRRVNSPFATFETKPGVATWAGLENLNISNYSGYGMKTDI